MRLLGGRCRTHCRDHSELSEGRVLPGLEASQARAVAGVAAPLT